MPFVESRNGRKIAIRDHAMGQGVRNSFRKDGVAVSTRRLRPEGVAFDRYDFFEFLQGFLGRDMVRNHRVGANPYKSQLGHYAGAPPGSLICSKPLVGLLVLGVVGPSERDQQVNV